MCIAALFTVPKLWNEPRSPPTDELAKKMQYTYTMEYYSAIKKNEMTSFVGKEIELEITLSK
jgi:hypothetical protein